MKKCLFKDCIIIFVYTSLHKITGIILMQANVYQVLMTSALEMLPQEQCG